MTTLEIKKSVAIADLMTNIERYKTNPSGIQRVIFDHLDEITNGSVNIVDPTNPFVFLLEASAVNTALAVNESAINTRAQYSELALTNQDLYNHMSDKDYLNRFATPSETTFTIAIQANDLFNKMVYSDSEDCYKATIPRDTEFTIDNYVFTNYYPIDFKRYSNGVLIVSFDGNVANPIKTLSNNIISYNVRKDNDNINWIFIDIPVGQFKINSSFYPIQASVNFKETIVFENQYFYTRVFHRKDSSLAWTELSTTHSDQVFDPYKPTALLKVTDKVLEVRLPIVYINTGLLSGDIRIDVYTTNGAISDDFSKFNVNDFSYKFKAIDEVRDYTDYVTAMTKAVSHVYCNKVVNSGTNGIAFTELRDRVINNNLGDRNIPITNLQLESYVTDTGFEIVKNVDVLTNRIFLAIKKLPNPLNTKLLTAANITINSLIANINDLLRSPNVIDNTDRVTIKSNTLFVNNNSIVSLLSASNIAAIQSLSKPNLVSAVNENNYLYNPYYYVLHLTSQEFEVRAYDLDNPEASNLNFKYQNETLQLPVNTASYTLIKAQGGYTLRVLTKSGNFYKQLNDGLTKVQLFFKPINENKYAYILGEQVAKSSDGERYYDFFIETNYDINADDAIYITNAKMYSNESVKVTIDLSTTFGLLYTTNSLVTDYKRSEIDDYLGSFLLPNNSAAVTYETIDITLGYSLNKLWTRARNLNTSVTYKTYSDDVPMLYDTIVYDVDPETNSIFKVVNNEIVYLVKHNIGDPVLDNDGNQVYKHRKGDIVYDAAGTPIIEAEKLGNKEIDMLFVDGKYYFVTDTVYSEYRTEIAKTIRNWIINEITDIQSILLEQTSIYFYPKSTLGKVKAYIDSETSIYIDAQQTFNITLAVHDRVYRDSELRSSLINNTIKILDNYIDSTITVNMSDALKLLQDYYGDTVVAAKISGLGGDKDLLVINLANEHSRLCLMKKLVLQPDLSLHIVENVNVDFINLDKTLVN